MMVLAAAVPAAAAVTVGAERLDSYLPMLRDKGVRVGLLTNHTGLINGRQNLDVLLDSGVNVTVIFTPEHGLRGTADAGEHVAGGKDSATGLPVVSLYGSAAQRRPSKAVMDKVDLIVTDIQDVGLRYYTYYCTMLDVMEAAAAHGKKFVILDRPNPNGMVVDGPVLDMKYKSGVGRLPVPVAHGMTLGELARMAVGEGWVKGCEGLDLTVIPCEGYTHATRYELPVAPSPNLPDMKSVYLYPSTCYFEATPMSLGRGTDMPFCVYGHPSLKGKKDMTFSFTPRSRQGAQKPPLMGRTCYGRDLRGLTDDEIIERGVDLTYIIDAYRAMGKPEGFFTRFFENLIGDGRIRAMIQQGRSADEIKATWKPDVERFRAKRSKYLIYPEK